MAKSLLTLTIAVPAYNEAVNIGDFLLSLFVQTHRNFRLREVIVYSDGSSDATPSIVRRLLPRYPVLRLVNGRTRQGKIYRLNQIFSHNRSDLLLVLDADIQLLETDFIDHLVSVLLADPSAQMVAAHQVPLCAPGLIARLIYSSYLMWDYIRLSVPQADHVQNFYGAATLYRRSFAGQLHIPDGLADERVYIYLMARRTYGFRYTYRARIAYWPVSRLSDFAAMTNRSFGKPAPELDRIFGFPAHTVCLVPPKYKFLGTIKSFWHHPFSTPVAFVVDFIFSRFSAKAVTASALWEITPSSKRRYRHD